MFGTAGAWPRKLWLAICCGAVVLLAGCGGAASDEHLDYVVRGGSQAKYGLEILTPELGAAEVGTPIAAIQLRVAGESAGDPLQWSIWEGRLPAGVALRSTGRLAGTPQVRGLFLFTVRATDGLRAGSATLALAVEDFGLYACAGLTAGEAWQGRPLVLSSAGATGRVVFDTVQAESGGHWGERASDGSRAVWHPGHRGRAECIDELRARDLDSGRSATLRVRVRPDPTAHFVAEFGSSDVWFVSWEQKAGAHPFATDLHAALAEVGLRDPRSTDRLGGPADDLAELWIRVETLRQLNLFFLRQADGSGGATGLPVSFPFEEPGAGYGKPPAGSVSLGGAGRYSQISLLDGRQTRVLGTAFTDDHTNRLHENDTTSGGGDLGVFVNVFADYFRGTYSPVPLLAQRLGPGDLPALRALLHETEPAGERYGALERYGRRFARALAVILAHEIGHSLGLQHDTAGGPDSIMSAHAPIAPWSNPVFHEADVAALRGRLPGPGRMFAADPTAHAHADGVDVCAGHACNLLLPRPRPAR